MTSRPWTRRYTSAISTTMFLVVLHVTTGVVAAESKGELVLQTRAFTPDNEDVTKDEGVVLASRLEYSNKGKRVQTQLRVATRIDALDKSRDVLLLEEGFLAAKFGPLRLRVGAQLTNWTTTEAFHPADVLNSRNFDSDVENLEKLGEPMVEARVKVLNGYLSAYYMPLRIAPIIPNVTSRLRPVSKGVELTKPFWIDRDGKVSDRMFGNQFAVHLSQTLGHADTALHFIQHNDRIEPTVGVDRSNGELHPVYHQLTQVGGTYAQAISSVVLKFEGAYRRFREPVMNPFGIGKQKDHMFVASGVEYAWTTRKDHLVTVIAEAQALLLANESQRAALNVFQRDGLVGLRYAFNDVVDRQFLVLLIVDLERPQEYVFSARYKQRLSDEWTAEVAARSLHVRAIPDPAAWLQITATRHF